MNEIDPGNTKRGGDAIRRQDRCESVSSNLAHSQRVDRHETLTALLERIPEGWTKVRYAGRPYGLLRTERVDGRSVSISAQELGGSDQVSANVYRTRKTDHLRACEMPEAKVLAFLRGWSTA